MPEYNVTGTAFESTDTAKTPQAVVSVGAASVEVVPANRNRLEVTVCNDHATQVLYLSLGGTAVVGQGVRLNAAGGSYSTSAFTGAINAIATGAATPACFSEI